MIKHVVVGSMLAALAAGAPQGTAHPHGAPQEPSPAAQENPAGQPPPSPPAPWQGVDAVPLPPPPAAPVSATPAVPARATNAVQARYQVRVMEGVLENAVQHGAQVVTMQLRQFSPDLMVFSGPARARGYRLEGYGVFFSVDVPAVRRSVTWSLRTLNQGPDLSRALQALRRAVQGQGDVRQKAELENALRLVELQVGPVGSSLPSPASALGDGPAMAAVTGADVPGATASEGEHAPPRDPDVAYEEEVKSALMDAMLDHGTPLNIGSGEWLTIAARDHEDRLVATELGDSVTIVLRISGTDLAEYRAGRLTRDEARRCVQVREF